MIAWQFTAPLEDGTLYINYFRTEYDAKAEGHWFDVYTIEQVLIPT